MRSDNTKRNPIEIFFSKFVWHLRFHRFDSKFPHLCPDASCTSMKNGPVSNPGWKFWLFLYAGEYIPGLSVNRHFFKIFKTFNELNDLIRYFHTCILVFLSMLFKISVGFLTRGDSWFFWHKYSYQDLIQTNFFYE